MLQKIASALRRFIFLRKNVNYCN